MNEPVKEAVNEPINEPIVTYGEVSFGKYGTAKVTVIDPNVTPGAKQRQHDALMAACRRIVNGRGST